MALKTINLNAIKSGYVDSSQPNTVITTNSSTEYMITSDRTGRSVRLYFGFSKLPASLKRNVIYGAQFRFYMRNGLSSESVWSCSEDFNPSTLTWYNLPSRADGELWNSVFRDGSYDSHYWADRTSQGYVSTSSAIYGKMAVPIANGMPVYIGGSGDTYQSSEQFRWLAKTVLSGGGAPCLIISYDNTLKVTSKPEFTTRFGNYVKVNEAATIKWRLVKNSDWYCLNETWTQASAKLYYKKTSASSWSTKTISGSMTKITKAMGDAKDGSGESAEAFASLGVSITDADGQLRSAQDSRMGGDTFYITIDAASVKEFNDIVEMAQSARVRQRMR